MHAFGSTTELALILMAFACFGLVALITLIALIRVFQKMSLGGWKAIIPFLNTYTLTRAASGSQQLARIALGATVACTAAGAIGGSSPVSKIIFGALTALVALIDLVTMVFLAKSFNKSLLFGLCLFVLPFIFLPLLGFGRDYVYDPQPQAARNSHEQQEEYAETYAGSEASQITGPGEVDNPEQFELAEQEALEQAGTLYGDDFDGLDVPVELETSILDPQPLIEEETPTADDEELSEKTVLFDPSNDELYDE